MRPARRKSKPLVLRRIGRNWNMLARTEIARTRRFYFGHGVTITDVGALTMGNVSFTIRSIVL